MKTKHKIVYGILVWIVATCILWLTEYLTLGVITMCTTCFIMVAVNTYTAAPPRSDDRKYSAKLADLENKTIAEDATLKLRTVFESLEKMITMTEFGEELKAELSTAYPDYMKVLQSAKNDLLRKDCSIVITGETSASKSTLINTLIGRKLFPVSNVAATGRVCRVRHSQILCVKTFDSKESLIKDEIVNTESELQKLIKKYSGTRISEVEMAKVYYVDVYLPVDILKGNVIIVDTPGIGESDELDKMLIDFLPNAVSMIFMVNANNAGGIQKGRLLRIFMEVIQNLDKMPCFNPREVIFLTNKWDIVEIDDTSGINEHEQTWETIMEKLKNEWTFLREENVFKVSLKQGKCGSNAFSKELKRFEDLLHKTILRNQNKRIKHHYSFLEEFIKNAERGTLARLQSAKRCNEDQQEVILKNTGRIQILQDILETKRGEFEYDKSDKTTKLTLKLHEYLHSKEMQKQIMDPIDGIAINLVGFTSLKSTLDARFENAIQVWLNGDEMKNTLTEVETRFQNLLRQVESKLNVIETEMTGSKTHLESNDICDNFMSESIVIVSGVAKLHFLSAVVTVYISSLVGSWKSGEIDISGFGDKMFRAVLKSLSLDKIRKCFEKSFSTEYERKIKTIFDIKLKQKVETLKKTNHQLDIQQETIRQKQHAYEILQEVIQKIERESDDFIATIKDEQHKQQI